MVGGEVRLLRRTWGVGEEGSSEPRLMVPSLIN